MSDSNKSDDVAEDFDYPESGPAVSTNESGVSKIICQICGLTFSSYSEYEVYFSSSHTDDWRCYHQRSNDLNSREER